MIRFVKTSIASHAKQSKCVGIKVIAPDLDLLGGAESVELVEQLQHGPLHLPVAGLLRIESFSADGILVSSL
jgi:hypothetical protein